MARSTRLQRIGLLGRERAEFLAYARHYVSLMDARVVQGRPGDDVIAHTAEDGMLQRLQAMRDARLRVHALCEKAADRIVKSLQARADLLKDLAGRGARDYLYVEEAAVFELLKVAGANTPDNHARVTQRVIAWLQDQEAK